MRVKLIWRGILAVCTALLAGCERYDVSVDAKPEKIGEYLYYVEYDDYIPEIPGSFTKTVPATVCFSWTGP